MIDLTTFLRFEHARWDLGTYQEVITEDCYGLKEISLGKDDMIIDVGANIGLFSGACLNKGAGTVVSVEASPHNFERLKSNMRHWENAYPYNFAVWRSDEEPRTLALNPVPEDGNTGGVNVLENAGPMTVETVGLDWLIGKGDVRILKVDCEGSEYPILYTSRKLHQVKEIFIEIHPVDHLLKPEANVRPGENTPEGMKAYLESKGFAVALTRRPGMTEGWAYIFARRA